jgi:K+/H+ antiporter YhaU regulatory subunit KhtT
MSYASIGANAIFNFLKNEDTWMLAEGLNIFRLKAPRSLVGKILARSGIREASECTIVALREEDSLTVNPDPQTLIKEGAEMILIGTVEGERKFIQAFQAE